MNRLALAACFLACAGCLSTSAKPAEYLAKQSAATQAAMRADLDAGRTEGVRAAATMAYWLWVRDALRPVPINPGTAARTIDSLPTQGVDPDLLQQGQLAAEKMRAAAASIDSMPAITVLLHVPSSRWLEAEGLSRAAMEQCQVIERMQPVLKARYGVEFPQLEVPKP